MHIAAGLILFFAAMFQSCDGLALTGVWGAWVHPEAVGVGVASAGPLALGLALLTAAAWQIAAAASLLRARHRRLVIAGAVAAVLAGLGPAVLDGELTIPRILAIFGAALAFAAAPRCHHPSQLELAAGGTS